MHLSFWKKQLLGAIALSALVFSSQTVIASPYDVYGAGTQQAAMGSTLTYGGDPGAIYYNAAALTDTPNTFSLGLFGSMSYAGIKVMGRPAGYDIPNLGSSSPSLPHGQETYKREHASGPSPLYGLNIGVVHNLWLKNLRIGGSFFFPFTGLLNMDTHFSDERERMFSNKLHWELVDQRIARFDIQMGIAYQVLEWFSIGMSASYLPRAASNLSTYVYDPGDFSKTLISSRVTPESAWSLGGGLVFKIPGNFRLAVAGKTSLKFDIIGRNDLKIKGINANTSQYIQWRPTSTQPSISAGLSWDLDAFRLSLDGKFVWWQDYLDTMYEATNFDNIVEVHLGARYETSIDNAFMIGAGFIPTPIPEQVGRTNYVDNHRLRFSMGGDHHFTIYSIPFTFAWAAQVHVLLPQTVYKAQTNQYPSCDESQNDFVCDEVPDNLRDSKTGQNSPQVKGLQTGNPGFPGWSSGGLLAGLQFEVKL